MKRMSVAVLAILLAMSMAGMAGCSKKRKGKKGRTSAGATDTRTRPTSTNRSSPSPSASDPPGATCDEALAKVTRATGLAWRFNEAQSQAPDTTVNGRGPRRCSFQTTATAALPVVKMVVTFYRIDRRVDSTAQDVRKKASDYVKCAENRATTLSGVSLSVQCLEKQSNTLFNVNTLLSGDRGYALVWVSMSGASTTLQTKAREIGGKAVDVSLGMI